MSISKNANVMLLIENNGVDTYLIQYHNKFKNNTLYLQYFQCIFKFAKVDEKINQLIFNLVNMLILEDINAYLFNRFLGHTNINSNDNTITIFIL